MINPRQAYKSFCTNENQNYQKLMSEIEEFLNGFEGQPLTFSKEMSYRMAIRIRDEASKFNWKIRLTAPEQGSNDRKFYIEFSADKENYE